MESSSGVVKMVDRMELPPGFRFHPTDEELITHYLSKKVVDSDFSAIAISEVDMNKIEPWELPWKAKIGEKEWYFFCVRDKKYPTGSRTNRATPLGYWKATGKDKEILRGKALVGMKKTLVFYRGRAPKGEKSNWVCHEYRLDGKLSPHILPKPSKVNDWVISRVFHKTSSGKKVHISGLMKMVPEGNELPLPLPGSCLPPLVDPSPALDTGGQPESGGHHVHCFSNPIPCNIQGDNDPTPNLPLDSFLTLPGIPWGQFHPSSQPGTGLYDASLVGTFLATTAVMSTEEYPSVVSNVEVVKKPLDEAGIVHPDFDCIWSY